MAKFVSRALAGGALRLAAIAALAAGSASLIHGTRVSLKSAEAQVRRMDLDLHFEHKITADDAKRLNAEREKAVENILELRRKYFEKVDQNSLEGRAHLAALNELKAERQKVPELRQIDDYRELVARQLGAFVSRERLESALKESLGEAQTEQLMQQYLALKAMGVDVSNPHALLDWLEEGFKPAGVREAEKKVKQAEETYKKRFGKLPGASLSFQRQFSLLKQHYNVHTRELGQIRQLQETAIEISAEKQRRAFDFPRKLGTAGIWGGAALLLPTGIAAGRKIPRAMRQVRESLRKRQKR